MSQFLNNFTAILESSLQKVRLKVDPSNKQAEDFSQYDGYVGYILAETDKEIDFFFDNTLVKLPKAAIIIEQQGFLQGLAGTNGTAGNAAGSLVRQGLQGVGRAVTGVAKAGLALHGIDPSKFGSGSASQPAQPAQPAPSSALKFPPEVDHSSAFKVIDVDGAAAIKVNNVPYGFLSIQTANSTLTPESFEEILDNQLNILEQYPQLPPSGTLSTHVRNSNNLPPPQSPQATAPTPQKQPPVIDVNAEVLTNQSQNRFITVNQLQINKQIFNKQVIVWIMKIEKGTKKRADDNQPLNHGGTFMRVGGTPEIIFAFSD